MRISYRGAFDSYPICTRQSILSLLNPAPVLRRSALGRVRASRSREHSLKSLQRNIQIHRSVFWISERAHASDGVSGQFFHILHHKFERYIEMSMGIIYL